MRPHSAARESRGQVLVITAVAMVVLLGIAALAIDLGFSWMLRRQEQNAADPAAIAAARHLKDPLGKATWNQTAGESDACFYARQNGFFPNATTNDKTSSGCVPANDPNATWLQVWRPPISGDYVGHPGKVQVIIGSTYEGFFGRIFNQPNTGVTTDAVAANEAGNSNSSSLVALQSECKAGSAADVDGGGEVRIFPVTPAITGGYVQVNSPCGGSTDDVCDNGVGSAALSISGTLRTPFAYVNGSCTYNGSGPNGLQCEPSTVTACLEEDALPLGDPLANIPEPKLSSFPNGTCPDGKSSTSSATKPCELSNKYCPPDPADPGIAVCSLSPGVFYGGWDVQKKVRLELAPGMYILAGGGISLTGTEAAIEAVTSPTGVDARVTIFSTDGPGCPSIAKQCQGVIKFTAAQAFKAKALNAATCGAVTPQACPWRGILLWQDGTVRTPGSVVTLGGQSSTVLAGTIYAPASQVEVSGGSATTGCASGPTAGCLAIQIISLRWKITGGGLVEMPYDPSELYQLDLRGLVE